MYSGPASIRMFTTAENTAMLEKARRHSFNAVPTSGCLVMLIVIEEDGVLAAVVTNFPVLFVVWFGEVRRVPRTPCEGCIRNVISLLVANAKTSIEVGHGSSSGCMCD